MANKIRIFRCAIVEAASEDIANDIIEGEKKKGYEPISISMDGDGRIAVLFKK